MLFNSLEYAFFLPAVLVAYWRLSHRRQNVLLLVASYIFYAAWDFRFLALLWISTGVDYLIARAIERTSPPSRRSSLLAISLLVNLGILGLFKYYGFFVDSAEALLGRLGLAPATPVLSVVLPVGISFYTFQTIAYTFDVYRGRIPATRSLLNFAVYVAFFPQLVAGPIERGRTLLPQIASPRPPLVWSRVRTGGFLILLGLFKKVAIADSLGSIVDDVFADPSTASTAMLLVGMYAFSLQIYGDFSGYTDIARGSASLLGIDLSVNFAQPYLSRNITQFWRTWHISLSSWLRDYLYIPLGGNRSGRAATYRNLMITMLLGGLWHGAAWTFVIWGGLHGVYLALHRRFRHREPDLEGGFSLRDVVPALATFHLVALSWIFFRADTISGAFEYLGGFIDPRAGMPAKQALALLLPAMLAMFSIDFIQRNSGDESFVLRWRPALRGLGYAALLLPIVIFSGRPVQPFIYFQF